MCPNQEFSRLNQKKLAPMPPNLEKKKWEVYAKAIRVSQAEVGETVVAMCPEPERVRDHEATIAVMGLKPESPIADLQLPADIGDYTETRRRIEVWAKEKSAAAIAAAERSMLTEIEKLRGEVQALEAWQNVAAESNRDMVAFLRERFSEWPDNFEGDMPTCHVRKVVEYLDNYNESLRQNLQVWHDRARSKKSVRCLGKVLDKLSGDLNHDNVAAAKEILKGLLKGE